MADILHNVIVGYWALLNLLIVIGGILGWVELRNIGKPRVVLYLSRVMIAEAIRAVVILVGIQRFHASLMAVPVYIGFSVFVSSEACTRWGECTATSPAL